ncbi:MAG: molybdate ABC transporter substrate-binding protein [Nitrospirae bacterium]|nr:molybdate ABC transporter substrate-binding protein [Nitrospirota bacterium]
MEKKGMESMIEKIPVRTIAFVIFLIMASLKVYAGEMTISAAASLTDALQEIGMVFLEQHPEHHVYFNFSASGPLMRQIEQGAPVDLFISASPNEMNELESRGLLIDKSRKDLLSNDVVLILPAGLDRRVQSFHDLRDASIKKIVIGDPAFVPCGRYAQEILKNLGIWDALKPKLIFGEDVRQVLEYVARDEVDAGVVFATDAAIKSGRVKVAAFAPEKSHSPVLYPVAIIKSSKNPELARTFLNLLGSPDALAIFKKYQFKPFEEKLK